MKYEFTIFGSGISAKIATYLLANTGFKVCLISDNHQTKEFSKTNLVTFLSLGSLNFLSSIFSNVQLFKEYSEIQKINCQLESLNAKKTQSIKFSDKAHEPFGKIVKNNELEKYLDKEINQNDNINIINSSRLTNIENTIDGVNCKLHNGDNINSDLFILSSTKNNIADKINIEFIKKDLEQEALSIIIRGHIKNENCAFQKFTAEGPLALLPYSKNEASVVWSLKKNSEILLKNNEDLSQIINQHLIDYVTSSKIISIEKHKLNFMYAKKLVYKHIILLGNVAHNIHPIAGQGLNLSIKDIALFVKQISKYKSLGYRLNDPMALEDFETKRKLDNAIYSFGTFSLDEMLSSNNKFINYTTRKGFKLVENNKRLKQMFVNSATGKDFFKTY